MPSRSKDALVWNKCQGRDGYDAPQDVPDNLAVELMNVIIKGNFFQKRSGSDRQAFSGTSFSGFAMLYRFVPGQSDVAAELIIASLDLQILRVAAGTSAAALILFDPITSFPTRAHCATLNGKCYIAYDSAVNRLHVFDPATSTIAVRRTGLAIPGAAAIANSVPGGTYGAVLRYYRIQGLVKVGGTLQRASNLGFASSFTPTGTHTAAVVTRPTFSEGETHWRVWGSADNESYFLVSLSDIPVSITTYNDTVSPSDYDDNDPAPDEGFFTPFPSVKYLLSTGDRLIGFGAWETTAGDSLFPRNGRVWFTPVLDSSDYDDDERVDASLGGWIDVSRDAGSEDRAIVGPLDNQILVGQSLGLFILIPTGNVEVPYRRITLTKSLGMVSQLSSFMGEDEFGGPCIYFLDPNKGPYRYGANGLQWCGYDVQDLWTRISLNATVVAHGYYDYELRRATWDLSVDGEADYPTERIIFHVREGQATAVEGVRQGWTRASLPGDSICSAMFAATMGTSMARKLKPYTGNATKLLRWESDTATTDDGTAFQSYATSKAYLTEQLNRFKEVRQTYLQAAVSTGTEIQLTITRDFGREVRRFSQRLNAIGVQTRLRAKYETAATVDAIALQFTVGDAAAIDNTWEIDHIVLPVEFQEEDR